MASDLSRIGDGDVLLATTYRPYRRGTVEAMKFAKEKGASIVSLTDSRTSPIAFMIAESDDAAVAEIESFHRKREEHAVYWADDNK